MSSHVFHEIYLHLNWHAKGDLPLLHGDLEILTHRELQDKCRRIKGAYLHGLGGTAIHPLKLVANTGRLKPTNRQSSTPRSASARSRLAGRSA